MKLDQLINRLRFEPFPFEPGHVWLAGAGPGGLGNVTLDVLDAVSRADAVVYDALVNPDLLQLAGGAVLHFAGKRGGRVSAAQDAINKLLVDLAGENKRVLRLKGGDPYIFGRGGEEALMLAKAGIPFRVLPGVTSAFAGLAGAGIPATMRGINRAVILATGHAPGSEGDVDWEALAATGQPIVIYMGLTNIGRIADALMTGGMSATAPAAVIQAATTPDERVLVATTATIAERAKAENFASPALVVFGDIVAMRDRLHAGKAKR
ncbi:MAG: uroporphyrinogen-III C-methyltransferase [Rhizobiaceae bacterium]